MDFIGQHLSEILSFLGGLLAGRLTVNVFSNRQSGNSKRQDFGRAKAGGDINDMPLRAVLNHPTINIEVYWAP